MVLNVRDYLDHSSGTWGDCLQGICCGTRGGISKISHSGACPGDHELGIRLATLEEYALKGPQTLTF